MRLNALTIAGSDSSGGAGIQADLRTFEYFQVGGLSALTAVTAQNSKGVAGVWPVCGQAVFDQIIHLQEDIPIDGVKIGMLTDEDVLRAVIEGLKVIIRESDGNIPVVLDPVLVSSSGFPLLEKEAVSLLIKELIPLATLFTPNLPEAETLLSCSLYSEKSINEACRRLADLGSGSVVLKGGHRTGHYSEDLLFTGDEFISCKSPRVKGVDVHGTGCLFSSAITANMVKGRDLRESLGITKEYVYNIIRNHRIISK